NRYYFTQRRQCHKVALGQWLIDLDEGQGVFADFLATQIQAPDIDSEVANKGGYAAQHTRHVIVENEKHMPFWNGFEAESVYAHDSGISPPHQSAGYLALALRGDSPNIYEAGEVAGFPGNRLGHCDPALVSDQPGVDHVDSFNYGTQQPCQHSLGYGSGVFLGDFSGILDVDFADIMAENLTLKQPELLTKRDIGTDRRQGFGGDRGNINGATDGAALEVVDELLGEGGRDTHLGLLGRGSKVGRQDYLIESEQRIVGRNGFLLEDIEGGPGNIARPNCCCQSLFIDQASASAVDNPDPGLHPF